MYRDLREFIAEVEERGTLRHIEGADPYLEIGGITEVAASRPDCPALLFDAIKGYPRGFRILTNATNNPRMAAIALGLDPELKPLAALRAWKAKRERMVPLAPKPVREVPYLENSFTGDAVDLDRIPVPHWHEKDGGPYIGSGSLVVTRDPDTQWVNAAIYRVQKHDKRRVTVQFDHRGRHGAMIAQKYWDKGQPCPIAIVNGEDPALFFSGIEPIPEGQSEYEVAGAIKGVPIEVAAGPATGIPLPARAEIILEGNLFPSGKDSLIEGPFGEFTGYYAGERKPCPTMEVTALHYRNDPILFGAPPLKPPRTHFAGFRAARLWALLEQAGVSDVTGVWPHLSSLMTVIALKQRYPGHAKRAGLIGAANSYMARLIVVVEDDIDPSSLEDVMWAVATRADATESLDIIRHAWSSHLDPRIPPEEKLRNMTGHAKLVIDACRPLDWIDKFPAATALAPDAAQQIAAKWTRILDGNR